MNIRDAIAFVLLGLILPVLFLAFTGSPGWLWAWVLAWIAFHLTAPTPEQKRNNDLRRQLSAEEASLAIAQRIHERMKADGLIREPGARTRIDDREVQYRWAR